MNVRTFGRVEVQVGAPELPMHVDVPRGVYRHPVAMIGEGSAHRLGPAILTVRRKLHDEDVVVAVRRAAVCAAGRVKVHGGEELSSHVDVARRVHRHALGVHVVGSADGAGPAVGPIRTELRHEHVSVVAAAHDLRVGVRASGGVEVHAVGLELPGHKHVARRVRGHSRGNFDACPPHGPSPAVAAIGIQFRYKDVMYSVARVEVLPTGRVKVHVRAPEAPSHIHVARRVHRDASSPSILASAHGASPAVRAVRIQLCHKGVIVTVGRTEVRAGGRVEVRVSAVEVPRHIDIPR